MAQNQVSDFVIAQLLLDYVLAQATYRSMFVGSGAASIEPNLVLAGGGNAWTARDLAPFSGRPVGQDGTTATALAYTPRAYVAPVSRRRFYFNMVSTIEAALGAGDAARVQQLIQQDAGDLWPKEMDQYCLDIAKAVFNTSSGVLRASNSYAGIAASSAAADVAFSHNGFIGARLKMGDAAGQLQALVVHSKVEGDIDIAESTRLTYQNITGPDGGTVAAKYYNGKRLIVSDNVATATVNGHTVYSSYLVGLGVFDIGIQKGPTAESGKLLSTGIRELLYEMSFGCGLVGCSWGGTPASLDAGATAAEVATAGNWTKVGDTKECRIVEYRSN